MLFAKHTMVAPLGFFDLFQVRLEFFLVKERGAVKTLQAATGHVSFPVRTGNAHHFDGFDFAGVGDVRPATQVDKLSLAIEADGGLICQAGFDVLDFQILVQVITQFSCFISIEHETFERLFRFDDLFDFRFDLGKVFFANRFGDIKVVVKPAFGGRTESQRDSFVETHHRASHDVGSRVTQYVQRFGVATGQQFQFNGFVVFGQVSQRSICIDYFAGDFGSDHAAGQPFADAQGDVHRSGVSGVFGDVSIGKLNLNG